MSLMCLSTMKIVSKHFPAHKIAALKSDYYFIAPFLILHIILSFSPSDDHKSKIYLDHCIYRKTVLLRRVAAQSLRSVAQAMPAAQTRLPS